MNYNFRNKLSICFLTKKIDILFRLISIKLERIIYIF